MSNDYIPVQDAAFGEWLQRFVQVAQANLSALGLTPDDIELLQEQTPLFAPALNTIEQQRKQLATAVLAKKKLRQSLTNNTRRVVGQIQSRATVPEVLKSELGLPVRRRRAGSSVPPTPLHIMGEGLDSGVNVLRWSRSGNKPGTQFVLEMRQGGAWLLVDVVTATRYRHTNQTPGVPVTYRVSARHGGKVSVPCPFPVTIYAANGYNSPQED